MDLHRAQFAASEGERSLRTSAKFTNALRFHLRILMFSCFTLSNGVFLPLQIRRVRQPCGGQARQQPPCWKRQEGKIWLCS